MSIAYFDCFSGVAGDMVLGALVDAGMPLKYLKGELKKLPVEGYSIARDRAHRVMRGTNLQVKVAKEIVHNDYASIRRMIEGSRLKVPVKELAGRIFLRLAQAEARIHGVPVDRVHFHEVGGVDSIVDIVGASIGFHYFAFDAIYSSPLPITRGRVKCAHGTFPVPAPATLEILKGIPLERSPVKGEIVTPTGAAIIATAAERFGECPLQRIDAVGYGYGDKVFPSIPNALRLMIGQGYPVVVVEVTLDDMNPQLFDYVMERLFTAGAVDVWLNPVQAKKNRPAVQLGCQVLWEKKDAICDIILRETTTFGVRYYPVERKVLARRIETVSMKSGKVRVKVGMDSDGRVIKRIPEYEDVKRIARKLKRPIIDVYRELAAKLTRKRPG